MQGEALAKGDITPEQHFTQPPPVIPRRHWLNGWKNWDWTPSTYASIVTTIQDREYVRKESNRLFPEDKGRIVTIFLLNFFKRYVEYDFTASLEDQLDQVSAGGSDYLELLSNSGAISRRRFRKHLNCGLPRCWMCWMTPWRTTLSPARGWKRSAHLSKMWKRHTAPKIIAHRRVCGMWQLP